MAKIKNTGTQPRGFFADDGTHVVIQPGEEAEFNMSEADFNKVKELAAAEDPPPFEISGAFGGVKLKTAKETGSRGGQEGRGRRQAGGGRSQGGRGGRGEGFEEEGLIR